jgi:hypothetical protein
VSKAFSVRKRTKLALYRLARGRARVMGVCGC